MAGASVAGLSRMFDTTTDRIESAIRRHSSRLRRRAKPAA
jgi:hypothetical protein